MPARKLTDARIRSVLQKAESASFEGAAKNILLGDGQGLYLSITKKATSSWLYRYFAEGKAKAVGLGAWPAVTLKAARDAAEQIRTDRASGVSPLNVRRKKRIASVGELLTTKNFAGCADAYINLHEGMWKNSKHRAQWRSTLKQYAFPVIGDLLIADITTQDIEEILEPIWKTKHETASRLRGRIEKIIQWSIARIRNENQNNPVFLKTKFDNKINPAQFEGNLINFLPRVSKSKEKKHHPSLPYQKLPDFLCMLQLQDGMARWALEFLILCANRTQEVTHAEWKEFNFSSRRWTIPATRMKASVEHNVPLSDRALQILQHIRGFSGENFVFTTGSKDKPMSNMAMAMLLRRMEKKEITVHGFRSTFRTWAAEEKNEVPFLVPEFALAHSLKDETVASYHRSDLFDLRVELMKDWTAFATSGLQSIVAH